MWANGSPGSTSPPKVRNTGRTASSSRLSVTTMSRIGCASAATRCQTPIVSNSRRAAATMADARSSPAVARAERRIGDRNGERRPERLAQRDRERQTGKAAAGNQHVERPSAVRHHQATPCTVPPRTPAATVPGPQPTGSIASPRETCEFVDRGPASPLVFRPRRNEPCPPPSRTSSQSSISSRSK